MSTIGEIHSGYLSGELDPQDVTLAALARIGDPGRGLHPMTETARREACDSARRYRRSEPIGVLDGIPVAVADELYTTELDEVSPQSGEAGFWAKIPVTGLLRRAGAVIVCTTIPGDDKFAVVANPDHPGLSAGGASAISMTAVRTGVAKLGFGVDRRRELLLSAAWSGCCVLEPTPESVEPSACVGAKSVLGPIAAGPHDLRVALNALTALGEAGTTAPTRSVRAEDLRSFAVLTELGPVVPVLAVADALGAAAAAAAGDGYIRKRIDSATAAVIGARGGVDFLMLPTSPVLAQAHGVREVVGGDGVVVPHTDVFTYSGLASNAGLPAVTLPWLTPSGLHAGVQIVGPKWSDTALLEVARRLCGV